MQDLEPGLPLGGTRCPRLFVGGQQPAWYHRSPPPEWLDAFCLRPQPWGLQAAVSPEREGKRNFAAPPPDVGRPKEPK
ncbi:hypothetical protein MC885_002804 [Smutsia gigantea]|nr:hypothetical protein MC885_002804 [Smutsia gigantea]